MICIIRMDYRSTRQIAGGRHDAPKIGVAVRDRMASSGRRIAIGSWGGALKMPVFIGLQAGTKNRQDVDPPMAS